MHTVCHRLSETHCDKDVAQYVRVLVNHVTEKVSCGPCFCALLSNVKGVLSIRIVPPAGGPTDHIQTFHVSFVATCRIFAHLAVWVVTNNECFLNVRAQVQHEGWEVDGHCHRSRRLNCQQQFFTTVMKSSSFLHAQTQVVASDAVRDFRGQCCCFFVRGFERRIMMLVRATFSVSFLFISWSHCRSARNPEWLSSFSRRWHKICPFGQNSCAWMRSMGLNSDFGDGDFRRVPNARRNNAVGNSNAKIAQLQHAVQMMQQGTNAKRFRRCRRMRSPTGAIVRCTCSSK